VKGKDIKRTIVLVCTIITVSATLSSLPMTPVAAYAAGQGDTFPDPLEGALGKTITGFIYDNSTGLEEAGNVGAANENRFRMNFWYHNGSAPGPVGGIEAFPTLYAWAVGQMGAGGYFHSGLMNDADGAEPRGGWVGTDTFYFAMDSDGTYTWLDGSSTVVDDTVVLDSVWYGIPGSGSKSTGGAKVDPINETLIVVDESSWEISFYMASQGAPNVPPIANITTANIVAGDRVLESVAATSITVDGSASIDPDGAITNYEWNSSIDGVVASGPAATTIEASALSGGVHTLTLNVTDNGGLWNTTSITADVWALTLVSDTVGVGPTLATASAQSYSDAVVTVDNTIANPGTDPVQNLADITIAAFGNVYVNPQITMGYDELNVTSETSLFMGMWTGAAWSPDAGVSVDTVADTVTSTPSSFSPHAVLEPAAGNSTFVNITVNVTAANLTIEWVDDSGWTGNVRDNINITYDSLDPASRWNGTAYDPMNGSMAPIAATNTSGTIAVNVSAPGGNLTADILNVTIQVLNAPPPAVMGAWPETLSVINCTIEYTNPTDEWQIWEAAVDIPYYWPAGATPVQAIAWANISGTSTTANNSDADVINIEPLIAFTANTTADPDLYYLTPPGGVTNDYLNITNFGNIIIDLSLNCSDFENWTIPATIDAAQLDFSAPFATAGSITATYVATAFDLNLYFGHPSGAFAANVTKVMTFTLNCPSPQPAGIYYGNMTVLGTVDL
jgi:hypothetical protein